MANPNRCAKCNEPIALNQTLCYSCDANEYWDGTIESESREQPNLYGETWDDSEYDEMDFDDD